MTAATVLTANIAYGFAGMDRLGSSLRHQLHVHGWGAVMCQLFPTMCGQANQLSTEKRVAYVTKHRNLGPTLDMIERVAPDLLVLNEVIYELCREELECNLRRMGFQTVAWGVSSHYPGTSLSTLVASKKSGTPIACVMPQRPRMGGGAGMAGLSLPGSRASVFGVHLTYRSPALFKRQIAYIARVMANERAKGNDVIVGGDWNECQSIIMANADFSPLNLVSGALVEAATCPTFFPSRWRKPLDHIFVPRDWLRLRSDTIAFGSDHLALMVEVQQAGPFGDDGNRRLPG